MTLRAIIFDLGDTLFRLDPMPDPRPAIARLLVDEGLDPEDAMVLGARLMDDVTAQRQATRSLVESDLGSLFRAAISRAGLPDMPGIAEACADLLGDADISRIVAAPGLAGDLARLRRRGFVLGAVSNTTTRGELLDAFLEGIGARPLLGSVVYSSVHGFKKPHPSIYEAALAGLGVGASDALFVGDRVQEDVLGPQSVGMRAVLTHEHRQEPATNAEPLAIIHRLSGLEAVVSEL